MALTEVQHVVAVPFHLGALVPVHSWLALHTIAQVRLRVGPC
jgi:phospholipid N-methyltransferase